MILNSADEAVLKTGAFYIRFCDDMLIMHSNYHVCLDAKEKYLAALRQLKLIPHNFNINLTEERIKKKKNLSGNTYTPFWKGKSKGPYKWDSIANEGFPWIGFVGYELHHEGHIRIRKKSFEKEINKQKKVIDDIRKVIKNGMRKSKGSVGESAIHRLVGMSVGRVTLKNFETISNDFCWKNGFKELASNKYSIQQIKQLDRNRSKLYYDFVRDIKDMGPSEKLQSKPRQKIYFNKPYSYYYQILERRDKGLE